MLIDQKKYQIVICDCDERFIESFLDDDMDAVVKQTAQYKIEKLDDKLVFYILLINGKKADQTIWEMFEFKDCLFDSVLNKYLDSDGNSVKLNEFLENILLNKYSSEDYKQMLMEVIV